MAARFDQIREVTEMLFSRKIVFIGLLIIIFTNLAFTNWPVSSGPAAFPPDRQESLFVNGQVRSYLLHLPPITYTLAAKLPLVIALHGGGGAPEGMERITGLSELADREGFAVCYPRGLNGHWNDGRETIENGPDDVAFIRQLIATLIKDNHIDPIRVYATGISNGGMMAERLGCEMADLIAAIAPVAATMPQNLLTSCQPARPLSVLQIHGTLDPLIPYHGGEAPAGRLGQGGRVASINDTVRFWVNFDKARKTSSPPIPTTGVNDGTQVVVTLYESRKRTADPFTTEVELITVVGGGHTWPGGLQYLPARIIGRTSRQFNASAKIWEFFTKHPLKP